MRNQIVVLGTVSWLMFAGMVHAAEIKVLSTQATEEAYRELVPQFEKASGHKVTTIFTGTLDANRRLAAGETYDLLIMSAPSIDEHIKAGRVVPGSRVDLAKSGVGVGVKAGASKPDISTTEALKKTLLAAKSIGYSTGPSGVYILACSSAWASPTRSRESSSRRRPACSSAASSPAGKPKSASSR
jgi:molybdate transport system substrate-binding protein